MPSKFVDTTCKYCGDIFKVRISELNRGQGKYCSRRCSGLGRRKRNKIIIDGDIAYIILTNRKGELVAKAIIDAADASKVVKLGYRWLPYWSKSTNQYFVAAKTKEGTIQLHRYILDAPDGLEVDHINHNSLDNRRSNLRLCTTAQNSQNRSGAYGTSKTGIRGVSWYAPGNKWRATITVNYKQISLGYYDNIQAAKKAAEKGRAKYMPFSKEAMGR